MSVEIALFEPEIPPNTGNIARLCVNAGVPLHIVGPPAFDLSEKAVRRAGLDYWSALDLQKHDGWESFRKTKFGEGKTIFLVSKFGGPVYWDVEFPEGTVFLFGKETSGLPPHVHAETPKSQILRIPMAEGSRSINLSNAVAIVLYEALRQSRARKRI